MGINPIPARVNLVPVKAISPNPHNPRRLFDEGPMKILKESINKLGVLVPITIYEDTGRRYFLLDGERRWRCALELKLDTIPAIIVVKPDDTQNILTMFHIHNVREGWQLMPTALKLKILIERLRTHNENTLNELTKLSISQIRRCKILLTYPKKFQNMMLAPLSERMKTDFFIELDRIRRPALNDNMNTWMKRGDTDCIDILLDKFLSGVIHSVTDFRRLAEVYHASQRLNKADRFESQFDRYLAKKEMTIEEIVIPGATYAQEAKEMNRSVRRLISQLEGIDLNDVSADLETVKLLKDLQKMLKDKLEDAMLTGDLDASNHSN